MKLFLTQSVERLENGDVETQVTITDENGDVLRDIPYTYENSRSTMGPAYQSLQYSIYPYFNCEIEVETNHYAFARDLHDIYDSDRPLAVNLVSVLDNHNVTLTIA